jgi:carbamoyl-phosphate synthase large subunit
MENREKFDRFLEELDIPRPKGTGVWSLEEGINAAADLRYPVLVRPSYVLGGQGMEICYEEDELTYYLSNAFEKDRKNPVLIDKYLIGIELEIDAVTDGTNVLIPGIMAHIERAGVHSGDSMTVFPGQNISPAIREKILLYTEKIATRLQVRGMINIQFIVSEEELYIIEVNPRASRTVPYVSKVSGIPIVELATRVAMGSSIPETGYATGYCEEPALISVKVPVFSTHKLQDVEISLGPEMRSTGEVLGIGQSFDEALYKGFLAAAYAPDRWDAGILLTIGDQDKEELAALAYRLKDKQFNCFATAGTHVILKEADIFSQQINRIDEGAPNILALISSGKVGLIVNTPTKGNDSNRDGFIMRRAATERNIPVYTSLDTFAAFLLTVENNFTADDSGIYDINLL